MDLWFIIKEHFVLMSFFLFIVLLSLFLLGSTWKNRTNIPKSLTAMITVIAALLIVVGLIAMIFIISFGYNA